MEDQEDTGNYRVQMGRQEKSDGFVPLAGKQLRSCMYVGIMRGRPLNAKVLSNVEVGSLYHMSDTVGLC